MTHLSKLSRTTVALAALCVAACASPATTGPEVSAVDPNVRFPVAVEPRMMTLRLPYDGGPAGIDQNASGQIARFAADYLDHGSGAIAVSAPTRYPDAPGDIAARLAQLGVPQDRILVGNQDESGSPNSVKLTYIRYVAQTPACGDWSTDLTKTGANTVAPNFGCATQHNIAAMVADPRDLVSPQALTPTDAQRRLDVLDKYRKGETTVAQKSPEQSGNVAEVGM
jgi:pilus assembly protein CpaD